MAVSELVRRTPEEEMAARNACFADCSSGAHLDPEAGCVGVCKHPYQCQGWVPYLSEIRAQRKEPKT